MVRPRMSLSVPVMGQAFHLWAFVLLFPLPGMFYSLIFSSPSVSPHSGFNSRGSPSRGPLFPWNMQMLATSPACPESPGWQFPHTAMMFCIPCQAEGVLFLNWLSLFCHLTSLISYRTCWDQLPTKSFASILVCFCSHPNVKTKSYSTLSLVTLFIIFIAPLHMPIILSIHLFTCLSSTLSSYLTLPPLSKLLYPARYPGESNVMVAWLCQSYSLRSQLEHQPAHNRCSTCLLNKWNEQMKMLNIRNHFPTCQCRGIVANKSLS